MKNIIIFGFGEMGRKLTDECSTYEKDIVIRAIADNSPTKNIYNDIPVIMPESIHQYVYDEIWVCTVYFEDIMNQLSDEYGIEKDRMRFVEPVTPILENRLRKKYEAGMNDMAVFSDEMQEVLTYLKDNPLSMYCYPFYKEYLHTKVSIQFDDSKGLYYGIYEGKRMYLAQRFNTIRKAEAYFNSVTMEQDLRSPHCYWNDERMSRLNGVGVDAGAAEGIFALKIIEQINHIYLVEADGQWAEALSYTFEPYKEKVSIIKKFVGNEDSADKIKLDSIIKGHKTDFMKIDIEGMELEALKGGENTLTKNKMQLAVCAYHHKNDNETIRNWLEEKGYQTKNSQGLVVCLGEWELGKDETDFRKALIFASNY